MAIIRSGKIPFWRSPNVLALGLVSLLTDTATEMAIPVLPLFLTTVLGAGALALGWIEGLADATASVLKLLSGRWADKSGRNKPFVFAGYTLSSTVRPLLAAALAPWHVLAVRIADRTGKGLRSSPRDALLAASVAPEDRGAAFGLHRAMDHAGAVLGPLLALALLALFRDNLRLVFALTAIPGALAVLTLLFLVKERGREKGPAERLSGPDAGAIPSNEQPVAGASTGDAKAFVRFLVPLGLFTLGNASDVFLLLKAGAERASVTTLPLLWMGLHVVKMVMSVPGGRLADRWGKRRTIALGWGVYVAIYIAFAFAGSPWTVAALFLAYGLYHGLTESPEKALVVELAPGGKQGTAFGWYHLTVGLLTLPASVLFGVLWHRFSDTTAFLTSAALALIALLLLALLAPRSRK